MIVARGRGDAKGGAGRPVLIGLTGPIGCGKSTVARMLGEIGGTVIDADVIARDVTSRGSDALPEIRARFGDGVFDGADLDRAELAKVVFSDAAALSALEAIVHPRVRRVVEQRLAGASREGVPFVVVEAIKLVEGGLVDRCDEVWLVECLPDTQRARLLGRGASAEDAARRLTAQGDDLVVRLDSALAGRIPARRLSTEGALEDTRDRVEDALARLLDARLR